MPADNFVFRSGSMCMCSFLLLAVMFPFVRGGPCPVLSPGACIRSLKKVKRPWAKRGVRMWRSAQGGRRPRHPGFLWMVCSVHMALFITAGDTRTGARTPAAPAGACSSPGRRHGALKATGGGGAAARRARARGQVGPTELKDSV